MTAPRPSRSALFVPAANARALEKSSGLLADVLIFDLEDSVAPSQKQESRERLRAHLFALAQNGDEARPTIVLRINPLATPAGTEDFLMARGAAKSAGGVVDAILLPKVESPETLADIRAALVDTDAPETLKLWAMIETPKGILAAAAIAEAGVALGLEALVVGPNDIVAATGIRLSPGRPELLPWLSAIILAAKAHGLAAIDGVYNDFSDINGLAAECTAGRAMGFDGKTLIHPAQIAPANLAFAPSADDIRQAEKIVAAFALPENSGVGVIRLDGQMVEILHRDAAMRLLALKAAIETLENRTAR